MVRSKDPNDILGPSGRGEENFVWADTAFGYTIRFENSASATAAARTVVITQQLDADLDVLSGAVTTPGVGRLKREGRNAGTGSRGLTSHFDEAGAHLMGRPHRIETLEIVVDSVRRCQGSRDARPQEGGGE